MTADGLVDLVAGGRLGLASSALHVPDLGPVTGASPGAAFSAGGSAAGGAGSSLPLLPPLRLKGASPARLNAAQQASSPTPQQKKNCEMK